MSKSAFVRAQAKVNLWLHVLSRETTGYHSIETVFHRIDLADDVTVTLKPTGERTLSCDVDFGPPEENLAIRAADYFCKLAKWDTGFHIEIVKRIPAGAGLGGGSADAGAVLRSLHALRSERPSHYNFAMLGSSASIAANLGADVAFLTTDAPMALAWGHGERLLRLRALPQRYIVLLLPGFQVATGDAYRWMDELGENMYMGADLSLDALCSWERLPFRDNDFIGPVVKHTRQAKLIQAITVLRDAGASLATMTGSGSTLFGVFEELPNTAALERATYCRVVLTKTSTAVEAVQLSD